MPTEPGTVTACSLDRDLPARNLDAADVHGAGRHGHGA